MLQSIHGQGLKHYKIGEAKIALVVVTMGNKTGEYMFHDNIENDDERGMGAGAA